jgi:hypothetical protein
MDVYKAFQRSFKADLQVVKVKEGDFGLLDHHQQVLVAEGTKEEMERLSYPESPDLEG